MENIYVGLRYVPIFDGDWDNTKAYEPLMIVSYQGNSYTSKTYVPVGAAIDNTDYWALTGNYNAQVEAYRQETARVSNALALKPYMIKYAANPNSLPYSALKSLNDGNDLRYGDFYTNLATNDVYFVKTVSGSPISDVTFEKLVNLTELQNLAATVGTIETTVDRLTTRKFIFIGDSYARGSNSTYGDLYTGFPEVIKNIRGLVSGVDYWKAVEGGAGFSQKGMQNHNFEDLLTGVYNSFAEVSIANTITDIVVCAGMNDRKVWNSVSDSGASVLRTAMQSFITFANTYFPNATVHVGMVGCHSVATERQKLLTPLSIYSQCGAMGNADYISNSEFILHNYSQLLDSDGYHPNQAGQNRLATFINSFLNGGDVDVQYGMYGGWQISTDFYLNMFVHNETTQIFVQSYDRSFDEGETFKLAGNAHLNMGAIAKTYGSGYLNRLISCPVTLNIQTTDNNWHNAPATVVLQDGYCFLDLNALASDGSGWDSFQVKRISCTSFGFSCPTFLL